MNEMAHFLNPGSYNYSMSPRLKAILAALLVTFLWSTSWVLIKLNIQNLPPLLFAGFRYTLAALILLPGLIKRKSSLRTLTRRDWIRLLQLGAVLYALTQGGVFLALKYLPATDFSLLLNFSTILVAFSGIILLKEIPSRLQWAGIVIFLIGVVLYFFPLTQGYRNLIGYAFALVTLVANAIGTIQGRAINRNRNLSPFIITSISMSVGAVLLLLSGLAFEKIPSLSLGNIATIGWLALVNTAFAFTLWNKTQQSLSAVESSIINNTMLIQIAILAWLILGESISVRRLAALILAALGVLLTNWNGRKGRVLAT